MCTSLGSPSCMGRRVGLMAPSPSHRGPDKLNHTQARGPRSKPGRISNECKAWRTRRKGSEYQTKVALSADFPEVHYGYPSDVPLRAG